LKIKFNLNPIQPRNIYKLVLLNNIKGYKVLLSNTKVYSKVFKVVILNNIL